MIRGLLSFCGGWGMTYLAQLASGRFRFPTPPAGGGPVHFLLGIANHFEPTWNGRSHRDGLRALRQWCADLAALGVKDADGHPFKHTYFFPAEQYHPDFLDPLAEHCAAGFGEVEVHLHHGEEHADTPEGLEGTLRDFVARLVGHGCLSCDRDTGRVGYAFAHGDWALANSAGGKLCGVDKEMEILARTGCYLDCTLPSAPNEAQVPVINAIYQCGRPLHERAPHRSGIPLSVGQGGITLPILLQGPLLIDWGRRIGMVRIPRLENGGLSCVHPPSIRRFRLWAGANVHIEGMPTWVFIKLHTHGLIDRHREGLLGVPMKQFLEEILRRYNDGVRYQVHFVTAREAANMICAAVENRTDSPSHYRDYRYVPVCRDNHSGMSAGRPGTAWTSN